MTTQEKEWARDNPDDHIYHDSETQTYYFKCPHCKVLIQVPRNEIRCTIFRHAVFKKNSAFVPPHAPKDECERWLAQDLVWGCAKPFKFNGNKVEICDYI